MSPAGIATVGVFATVPYPFFLAYLNRNIFETAIPFLSAEPSSRPGSRHTSGLRPASGAEPTRPANPGEAFYGANVYDCGRPSVYSLNGLNRSKRSIGYQWTVQPQNKRMNGRSRSIKRLFVLSYWPWLGSLSGAYCLHRTNGAQIFTAANTFADSRVARHPHTRRASWACRGCREIRTAR